jgi:chromosome segregation ATPase
MPNFQDQVDFALREAGFVQIARNFYALFTRLFIGGSGAVDVIELDRILNMRFKNFE